MSTPPTYPACEQMSAVAPFSQHVGDFLDWLREQGIVLAHHACPHGWTNPEECEESKSCRRGDNDFSLWHHGEATTAMLARFYDVDLDAVERERRAMLEALRAD